MNSANEAYAFIDGSFCIFRLICLFVCLFLWLMLQLLRIIRHMIYHALLTCLCLSWSRKSKARKNAGLGTGLFPPLMAEHGKGEKSTCKSYNMTRFSLERG